MRRRSENLVGSSSFLRAVNQQQRNNDKRNSYTEEYIPRRQKRTNNVNSIEFERKFYSERYK